MSGQTQVRQRGSVGSVAPALRKAGICILGQGIVIRHTFVLFFLSFLLGQVYIYIYIYTYTYIRTYYTYYIYIYV